MDPATPVWVNGRLCALGEATWPVFDPGLLHGRAVFTTVPLDQGRTLFLDEHLARLAQDGAAFAIPFDPDRVRGGLAQLLPRLDPAADALRIHLGAPAGPAEPAPLALLPRVRAQSAREPVIALGAGPLLDPFSRHKSVGRHGRNVLAQGALEGGADDVLLYGWEGQVLGAHAACALFQLGRELATPSVQSGALAGVGLAVLLAAFARAGVEVSRRAVALHELEAVKEVVLVGSVGGVRAARALRLPAAPIGTALERALRAGGGEPWGGPRSLPGDQGPLAQMARATFAELCAAQLSAGSTGSRR